MCTPRSPDLLPGVVRGCKVSSGGALGAAPTGCVSSGGVELIVVVAVAPLVLHLSLHDVLYVNYLPRCENHSFEVSLSAAFPVQKI